MATDDNRDPHDSSPFDDTESQERVSEETLELIEQDFAWFDDNPDVVEQIAALFEPDVRPAPDETAL